MRDLSPILLMITKEDLGYVNMLKPLLKGRQCFVIDANPDTAAEIELYAKSKQIKYIISTNSIVLNKVVDSYKHQSLDNWQGSLYERNGITYLFLNPLKHFFTVPYGKFVAERFISKIVTPSSWTRAADFSWEVAQPDTIARWYDVFSRALLIAQDIETVTWERQGSDPDGKEYDEVDTAIRCICYTGLWEDGNIHTIVIPLKEARDEDQGFWLVWYRKFNQIKVPRIFQNGLYDNFHDLVYNAPSWGYYFDTQSLFHSWYSELPKRLDFITAFLVHNSFYWKDLGTEKGKLFEYNARDGWATMCSFLALMKELPAWAITNYKIKFPLWVPCLASNLEGIKVDNEIRSIQIAKYIQELDLIRARLQKWFGDGFNPGSPQQVVKLISFYGSPDITSSDEPSIIKFSLRHPLNARFTSEILRYREVAKIISTYLKPKHYSVAIKATNKRRVPLLKKGRLYFSLNPDGTDTGRLACKESAFWCGSQIQNQPPSVKEMMLPEDSWILYEIDNERSESYCSGYLSGDKNLIEALRQDKEEGKDFHIGNAVRFFGVEWDQVTDELRFLGKKINHGSTYNMGWQVLLISMGEFLVDKAKALLKLPPHYTRRETCEHLLHLYEKAFPTIKTTWYQSIKVVVRTTRKLVSPLGWTRYCFGNPERSKHELNALVAHSPQNLSVGIINEAYQDIYWNVQYKNPNNFRLKAQIHDSIFFQARIGCEHLAVEARNLCVRPKKIPDCQGTVRTMEIPVAVKRGKNWLHMTKWKDIPKYQPS